MSAATQIGIDSCPIEGFTIAQTTELLTKHKVIDPLNEEPCVFCALGYKLEALARPKARLSLDELIRFIN